ncbi:serine hydrolase [Actinoplanes oblitus]|uniref:Serine hydrolase n=1 Tax=Actinoplanes oblitus TaxID=3040509 RepID=A0ABY8WR10_9ACTN|nr:serine hydrolase [Actinoplanes oblitus]WIM99528.1 serine hydrolase [Actinoplanes oblitus]
MAILAVAAAVVLGGGGLIYLGLDDDGADGASVLPGSLSVVAGESPSPAASPSPTGPSPEELARAERAKRTKQLDAALKKLSASSPEFSVAVQDRTTGETYTYRGDEHYDTASIVKAQILACMLLKDQDAGREPSSSEMTLAKPMIQLSDNNATTSLFQRLGGKTAISRCNKRLGLSDTVVNTSWGLTRTTVKDQIRLLAELVDSKGPLDAGSRKTAFKLMNTVNEAQDWGVPAIAKPGETFTVKNGWDTRSADGGLWAINTIGRVTSGDDVDASVAVLSHNNQSMEAGIALVEKVAKLTRQYLEY